MKKSLIVAAGIISAIAALNVSAAVSEEEAAQLGTTLTLFGAIKAGNAEGTIPEYTGGIPTDYAPAGWDKNSGRYEVASWDDEKPVLSISGANMEQYKDKLTAGTQELLRRYPEMRVDVYPTHRSMSYDDHTLSLCKSNALNATLTESGYGIQNAHGCAPFPIPKAGLEVMWNYATRNQAGPRSTQLVSTWMTDKNGRVTDVGHILMNYMRPYLDRTTTTTKGDMSTFVLASWQGPASQVGTRILQQFPYNYDAHSKLTWSYTPGQRRTRLAPEFGYDTPIAANGGAINYDEANAFDGEFDRYDFNLAGKREMYVPYNGNKLLYAPTSELFNSDGSVSSDVSRWELHRVWVVELTLKEGKRHAQPRRTLYVDEDTWNIVATDAYDRGGNMSKVGLMPVVVAWDWQTTLSPFYYYNLNKGVLYIGSVQSRPGDNIRIRNELNFADFTPDALTRGGVR